MLVVGNTPKNDRLSLEARERGMPIEAFAKTKCDRQWRCASEEAVSMVGLEHKETEKLLFNQAGVVAESSLAHARPDP